MLEEIWSGMRSAWVLPLFLLLCTPPLLAGAGDEGLPNAFFAFDNGVGRGTWSPQQQADVLNELGYSGIGYTGTEDLTERLTVFAARGLKVFSLYVPCYPGETPPFAPQLKEVVKGLDGTETMLWLTVQGNSNDEDAARVVREIADAADEYGVKVALYPHYEFQVATTRDAVRLAKRVDRGNVGVSINLCHELRSGNEADLNDIIDEAAPYLYLVSINGADHQGGWDKLIQTLDQGEFDVLPFLERLHALHYTGPIGLQCYNVAGDQRENLKTSMAAWKTLSSGAASGGNRP